MDNQTGDIQRLMAEKAAPIVEPSVMALIAAIGRLNVTIIQELAVMAKGFADDGMTLEQFSQVLTGEMFEEGESDADAGSSDDSDS